MQSAARRSLTSLKRARELAPPTLTASVVFCSLAEGYCNRLAVRRNPLLLNGKGRYRESTHIYVA